MNLRQTEALIKLTEESNAISTIRNLILEWAVRGKLCGENSSEWKDASLGDLIDLISGQHLLAEEHNSHGKGIPYLTGPSDFGEKNPLPTRWTEHPKAIALPGDILITVKGSGVGKTNLLSDKPTAISRQLMAVRVKGALNEFVHIVLKNASQHFQNSKTGIAIPGIGRKDVLDLKVVLPPLAEQKRIVAKVDELMALCDRLEAQLQERDTQHVSLSKAALARFADDPTPANLEYLFHHSFDISPADLRKTILTLAVQGKLVPQDEEDEPVELLLQRITEKRVRLSSKNYGPVSTNEYPYDIPDCWAWIRLGNIALTSDSGWSPQCLGEARSGDNWGVLKVSAVTWGTFRPNENKALPPGEHGRPDCEVHRGDFLLSRANTEELVARSVVIDQTPQKLMMSDKIVRFVFPDEVDKHFVNLANLSDSSREYYSRNASGTSSSMKNIGREVMCKLPIPLPPLAEQKRIVAKVDELMALVDQLESQLAECQSTGEKLMEALVAELTASE